jgi:23S rRNA (adenine1618-N6)-methyltransferase
LNSGHHSRNRHQGHYDFAALVRALPALASFVRANPSGESTIDFADPAAVRALNQALLQLQYGVTNWDIPPGYLCPPIPGRADYIHYLADLLAEENPAMPPRGPETAILDIGVGANCVYPIVGATEYGWRFVGTDVDPKALASAQRIIEANPALMPRIELRRQPKVDRIFDGVVRPRETFTASMCNPPFHESAAAATAGTQRKLRNLGEGKKIPLTRNFGGQSNELWCRGGEVAFIRQIITESVGQSDLCRWFTTLVSNRDSLPSLYRALEQAKPADVRTIDLAHGQKKTRILAWRFRSRLAAADHASDRNRAR